MFALHYTTIRSRLATIRAAVASEITKLSQELTLGKYFKTLIESDRCRNDCIATINVGEDFIDPFEVVRGVSSMVTGAQDGTGITKCEHVSHSGHYLITFVWTPSLCLTQTQAAAALYKIETGINGSLWGGLEYPKVKFNLSDFSQTHSESMIVLHAAEEYLETYKGWKVSDKEQEGTAVTWTLVPA